MPESHADPSTVPVDAVDPAEGQEEDVTAEMDDRGRESKRERSTIRFPYGDLADAEQIAMAVANYGNETTLANVAGSLGQLTTSGAFRTKVSTAQVFGLVESVRGKGTLKLLDLGARIHDPDTRVAARVDALLEVPLYKAIYDAYAGRLLPNDAGIESSMVGMGVAEKQAPRARQAFSRSAEQAGFFASGRNRLVVPATGSVGPGSIKSDAGSEDNGEDGGGTGGDDLSQDALLVGLFNRLPKSGTFPARERRRWIKTLEANLDMVYGDDETGDDERSTG